ncbi:hypothetical protein PFISCL1PPCAC_24836, partial [Pristionchus fissidentatus]
VDKDNGSKGRNRNKGGGKKGKGGNVKKEGGGRSVDSEPMESTSFGGDSVNSQQESTGNEASQLLGDDPPSDNTVCTTTGCCSLPDEIIDRLDYAPFFWNVIMILCTIVVVFVSGAFFFNEFSVNPISFCSPSLIPNVSSDGKIEKNIWKDDLFFIPCNRASSYNKAIQKQIGEGIDEETGKPRTLIEKIFKYQRAVARVTNRTIPSLTELLTDKLKGAECKLMLNATRYQNKYMRSICFVKWEQSSDEYEYEVDEEEILENSRKLLKEVAEFAVVGHEKRPVQPLLTREMRLNTILGDEGLLRFQTISFSHSFMFGEYRKEAMEEASRRDEEGVWKLLEESIISYDHEKFVRTVEEFINQKPLTWYMRHVVLDMIDRLTEAQKENPTSDEMLLDWINSPRIWDRLGKKPLWHHCTGVCERVSPSPRLFNDWTLAPCKWTLYFLSLVSLSQIFLHFDALWNWIMSNLSSLRRDPTNRRVSIELENRRSSDATEVSTTDDDANLIHRRRIPSKNKGRYSFFWRGPVFFGSLFYVASAVWICVITLLLLIIDFYYMWNIPNPCGSLCNFLTENKVSAHRFSYDVVVVWRLFLYFIITPIFVDMMFYFSYRSIMSSKKIRRTMAIIAAFLVVSFTGTLFVEGMNIYVPS